MPGWGMPGMMMGGGFAPRRFEEQYHCYSVAYADKAHLEVRVCECACVLYYFPWRNPNNDRLLVTTVWNAK